MPRASASAAARSRLSRSPCARGISTGTAGVPAATSSVASVRLSRIIGAGLRAAAQFLRVAGIDADAMALGTQAPHGLLQMRKREAGPAAEVDHVRALGAQRRRARSQRVERQRRRIDDLGEDARVVAAEIGGLGTEAEEGGQVGDLLGAAHECHAELRRQRRLIEADAAGQDDAVGLQRARQAAAQDRLGHQGGDLDPDILHAPGELRVAQLGQQPAQPRLGEMAGEEQQAFSHRRPTRRGVHPARRAGRRARARRGCARTRPAARCFPGRCGADRL